MNLPDYIISEIYAFGWNDERVEEVFVEFITENNADLKSMILLFKK